MALLEESTQVETSTDPSEWNGTTLSSPEAQPLDVTPEELLIVLFVLVLWVAAIALFINRWGKIRMLEPYQPKFQQQQQHQHRAASGSLALAPTPVQVAPPSVPSGLLRPPGSSHQPRRSSAVPWSELNSSAPLLEASPRRARSAFDLQVLTEACVDLDEGPPLLQLAACGDPVKKPSGRPPNRRRCRSGERTSERPNPRRRERVSRV
ncbi:uncharacterized protein LOC105694356 [Orussus abietinus]|uniref:uncharacterized protein LOC105694356 n=1 Tax=Orussus abietinus TaxID=222816 RepID=UPI0006265894|nr:uncharacterized protein LOC105694356 [Orussus abietinus]